MTDSLHSAQPLLPASAPLRAARLLFSDRLADSTLSEAHLAAPGVLRALMPRPVPSPPVRYAQRLGMKADPRWFERHGLAPLLAAREAVLGEAAAPAPPRFLLRVDEYPLAGTYADRDPRLRAGIERFHATLTEAGIPYMMAVCPAVSRDYLDPSCADVRPLSDDELTTLQGMRDDGVEFALHGFDHRTRDAHPRRHSELAGLDAGALSDLLDRGMERLGEAGLESRVFVAPFNRFDAAQYDVLAERFDVVCGGPETVSLLGFHRTPLWRGEAAYLPAYAPFYGPAATVAEAVRRSVEARHGLWIPIVLHWSWEIGAWGGLERLVAELAGLTHSWTSFARAAEPDGETPSFVADLGTADQPEPVRPGARLLP